MTPILKKSPRQARVKEEQDEEVVTGLRVEVPLMRVPSTILANLCLKVCLICISRCVPSASRRGSDMGVLKPGVNSMRLVQQLVKPNC